MIQQEKKQLWLPVDGVSGNINLVMKGRKDLIIFIAYRIRDSVACLYVFMRYNVKSNNNNNDYSDNNNNDDNLATIVCTVCNWDSIV